jgi:putative flippase GtrA
MWRLDHAGLFSQGMRFAFTGCVVSAVYLLTTSALTLLVGLPFQVALAIGFAAAVAVHFSMQRLFVWTDHGDFALAFPHQVSRYLLVAGTQYGVTVLCTSLIPSALGLTVELVYLTIALPVAFGNFLLFRYYIFHGKPVGVDTSSESA